MAKNLAIEQGYQQAQQLLRESNWVEAARAFAGLMPTLREQGDTLGQARVLTHLAQIFGVLEQNEQALEFYREARRLAIEAGDQQLKAICAHQLGCLLRQSEPEQAKAMLQESRSACVLLGDLRGETLSLALIGEIDLDQGDGEAGMRKMLQAVREMPEIAEREELIRLVGARSSQLPFERFEALLQEQIPTERLRQRVLDFS